jgi:pimeloyl-ACP methyl ester carboxylesterase
VPVGAGGRGVTIGRRVILALALALGGLMLAALTWPRPRPVARRVFDAAERRWLILTGGLVDVGGYRLRADCAGAGDVTVVLDSGLCQPRKSWGRVPSDVAAFARVCTYDRAGVGDSDPDPLPRTGERIVRDLETVLAKKGASAPYVLVGHSFGGLNVRLFASRHPEQVAGLVLVDASHEDQYRRLSALMSPEDGADYLAHEGGKNCEHVNLPGLGEQVRAAPPPPPVPLVVLSARERWPTQGCAACQAREEMQAALAQILPAGRRVLARGSGHFIQLDQPQLVVDAIRDVVEAARTSSIIPPSR